MRTVVRRADETVFIHHATARLLDRAREHPRVSQAAGEKENARWTLDRVDYQQGLYPLDAIRHDSCARQPRRGGDRVLLFPTVSLRQRLARPAAALRQLPRHD